MRAGLLGLWAELILVHLLPISVSATSPSSPRYRFPRDPSSATYLLLPNHINRVRNADKYYKCSSFEFNTHGRPTIPLGRTVPPQFEYIV